MFSGVLVFEPQEEEEDSILASSYVNKDRRSLSSVTQSRTFWQRMEITTRDSGLDAYLSDDSKGHIYYCIENWGSWKPWEPGDHLPNLDRMEGKILGELESGGWTQW